MINLKWPTGSTRITCQYGPRERGDKFHDGIDIGAKIPGVEGDQVRAMHNGKVSFAGNRGVYGNLVIIDSIDGTYSTVYGHLKDFKVKKGDNVLAGYLIGLMGNTGESTGAHLHIELRTQPFNPTTYWNSTNGKFYSSVDPTRFFASVEKTSKEIIQEKCKFSNPDEVFKLLEAHKYADDLFKKWADSYK